ncbi:hypothetical protein ABZ807_20165 [Micromonospora sp. NPDC047548]|uniref:hypothetical protein n=1 Tax=Micromonospora sp. NPDC047548 TaxID=3155624 RepID=UPI0033E92DE7
MALAGHRAGAGAARRPGRPGALSALLLTATADGLATAPISDTIELAWPRRMMRELVADVGEPYLVVRVGWGRRPVTCLRRRAAPAPR